MPISKLLKNKFNKKLYDSLIEKTSPIEKIELFARNKRLGRDCWGNKIKAMLNCNAIAVNMQLTARFNGGLACVIIFGTTGFRMDS